MKLYKHYIINEKPLQEVLNEVQSFINIYNALKENNIHYEYDIKILKLNSNYTAEITITYEKQDNKKSLNPCT